MGCTNMNNKKILISAGAAILLAGCSGSIKYEGKTRTYDQAEEMIEDKIEKENPGQDYEVSITTESKKKKKRGKR